jgi:NitT/TauT family transport system substrate-binding protein
MAIVQSRRRFVTNAAVAGAAGFATLGAINRGGGGKSFAAEPPPEITTIRLERDSFTCIAPQIVEELLRAEGFTDIRYLEATSTAEVNEAVASGKVDFNMHFAPQWASVIDRGGAVTVLSGVHVGCYQLFGNEGIHGIADLKGKAVGVTALGGSDHLFVSVMAAHIGLDPASDIHWVTSQSPTPAALFAEGKIDACLGLPTVPQDLRARHIGHVVVDSALDRPWSQYFCCMLAGHRDYVQKHPIATKRVLRAILKAADLCASEPARAAQRLVDGGFAARYDYALQTMRDVSYDKWQEYEAEDTLRYYALRLHDLGFVKSTPQEIVADGTDWRFLDELKRELKA